MVPGWTVLGGYGFELEPGTVLALAVSGGLLTFTDGPMRRRIEIAAADLEALEVGGPGATQSGGGFIGGGFGLEGMAVGFLAASVLNGLTSKTSVNSTLRVAGTSGELILHHGALIPDEIRFVLAPAFGMLAAAQRQRALPRSAEAPNSTAQEDVVSQLERIIQLRDAGALTPEEFELVRERLVRQLTGGARA